MIFLRRIFITYSISRYSVIFLRFTSQLLSFCDLWSECGSEVTGLRKIIWDLLFLSYSSNLMFVAIVPTALALIIFVSLSWVKNWSIKSQFDKNKGIYPWFKLDETCVKFMFSKKATKFDKIFIVDLTLCSKRQINGEDVISFCGLLRKH